MKPKLIILPDGIKEWYLNDKLHRKDGPAVEWPDGSTEWYLNGKRHRENGPAAEWFDDRKYWYVNGKYHQGTKFWYLNGKQLTKRQLLSKKMKIDYPELYKSYLIHQIMES